MRIRRRRSSIRRVFFNLEFDRRSRKIGKSRTRRATLESLEARQVLTPTVYFGSKDWNVPPGNEYAYVYPHNREDDSVIGETFSTNLMCDDCADQSVSVKIKLWGSATYGADYRLAVPDPITEFEFLPAPLPGEVGPEYIVTVTIPENAWPTHGIAIYLPPILDTVHEGSEFANLTIEASSGYAVDPAWDFRRHEWDDLGASGYFIGCSCECTCAETIVNVNAATGETEARHAVVGGLELVYRQHVTPVPVFHGNHLYPWVFFDGSGTEPEDVAAPPTQIRATLDVKLIGGTAVTRLVKIFDIPSGLDSGEEPFSITMADYTTGTPSFYTVGELYEWIVNLEYLPAGTDPNRVGLDLWSPDSGRYVEGRYQHGTPLTWWFGLGWGIRGLDNLYLAGGGRAILFTGDRREFNFHTDPLDSSKLIPDDNNRGPIKQIVNEGAGKRIDYKDGSKASFLPTAANNNLLGVVKRVDSTGNMTSYQYDLSGTELVKPKKIVYPDGQFHDLAAVRPRETHTSGHQASTSATHNPNRQAVSQQRCRWT